MTKEIDFGDGFTSASEPTTKGAIASFVDTYANDAAYEAVFGSGVAGDFYFDSTLNTLKINDGTAWRSVERALDNATTTDPLVTSDSDSGYEVLSLWLNTSSAAFFRATDVTVGAAVWQEVAADSIVDTHIADTTAHGATGAVVGTTNAQVLTLKDYDGGTATNTSRMTVPKASKATLDALTRKQGTLAYASDEDKLYKDDGSTLSEIGSAGGGGLDVFSTEDFETTNAADLTTGQNATFDNAGTIGGALADVSSGQLSGTESLKYTTHATPGSSDNDFVILKTIALDPKQVGNDIGCTFYYTWDGSDDLIEAVLFDDTNNVVISSSLDLIKTKSNSTRFSFTAYIPASCTSLKMGVHHTGTSEASKVLVVDDIEFSTNPFVYKNLTETQYIQGSGGTADGSTNTTIPYVTTVTSGGAGLLTVASNSTDGTSFTAVKKCKVVAVWSDASTVATYLGWSLNSAQLTTAIQSITQANRLSLTYQSVGTSATDVTAVVEMEAGDVIRAHGNGDTGFGKRSIQIIATSESEHVVTPATSNMTDWTAFTPVVAGCGTITGVDTLYKRVGDSIQLMGIFSTGTVAASEFQLGLPIVGGTQLTVGAEIGNLWICGSVDSGISTTTDVSLVATAGDAFLNGTKDNATIAAGLGNALFSSSEAERVTTALIPIEQWDSSATFLAAIPVQKVCFVEDQKASGTAGGTSSATPVARDLNTLSGDNVSMAVTLDGTDGFAIGISGEYVIEWGAPAYDGGSSNRHKTALYNESTTSYVKGGTSARTFSTSGSQSESRGQWKGVVAAGTVFAIFHEVETSVATSGWGQEVGSVLTIDSGLAANEVYTQVKITKLR